jgi:hypothetical protein
MWFHLLPTLTCLGLKGLVVVVVVVNNLEPGIHIVSRNSTIRFCTNLQLMSDATCTLLDLDLCSNRSRRNMGKVLS